MAHPVLLPVPTPHHDVLRLQVQVNDIPLVDEDQSLHNLPHKLNASFFIEIVAAWCHFLE